jgi:glycosyltransferase involved in cell wall biosynthesis
VLASSLLLVIELTSAVTTKVYEYLAAGRPILAIVSPGELEQLVRDHSRTSYVITSCDVREIEDSIVDAYEKWTKNEVPRNDVNQHYLLSQYDRKKLTEDLARVFDLALGQQTDQNSIIHQ